MAPAQEFGVSTIYVGPYILAKAGINTKVSDGFVTDAIFNNEPDFGLSLQLPVTKSKSVALGLDIGLASNQTRVNEKGKGVDSTIFMERYRYLSFSPYLYLFEGFVIGVQFMSPMNATVETRGGTAVSIYGDVVSQGAGNYSFAPYPLQTDVVPLLASLTSLRIGGVVPFMDESYGRLNVNFNFNYPLGGAVKDLKQYCFAYPVENGVQDFSTEPNNNPQVASFSMGISYFFNLTGK